MLCSVCGEEHSAKDIEKAFQLPDVIFELSKEDRERRAKIASNFCALEERVFVRGLVPVPIINADEIYCWGFLANLMPAYESTRGLPETIVRQASTRPFFYITDCHPLQDEQRSGITQDMPIHCAHL